MATSGGTIHERLVASGLVSSEQLQQVNPSAEPPLDEDALLERLLARGLLSEWHVQQLRAGVAGGFFLGPYKLMRPLGGGGMGRVFEACHARTADRFAIKVVAHHFSARNRNARFLREARAALELRHRYIVETYELREMDSRYYLVMELMEGGDLRHLIAREGKLTVDQTATIAYEVLKGLRHAHRRGIIHRDIKPSNILLTSGGTAKIGDLGLAKFRMSQASDSDSLTATGVFMGTADYCAPEQAEDAKHASPASDIYALGCTLYHCLTGQPPFPGGTEVQKIVAHRERQPQRIEQLNPAVPTAFADLIHREMLAKKPVDRFPNAGTAAQQFRRWSSIHRRGWRRAQRHRSPPALGAGQRSGLPRGAGGGGREAAGQSLHGTASPPSISLGGSPPTHHWSSVTTMWHYVLAGVMATIFAAGIAALSFLLQGKVRVSFNGQPTHDGIAFRSDGIIVASIGAEAVTIRDSASGDPLGSLPVRARCLAFSPTGSKLAMACATGVIKLWDSTRAGGIQTKVLRTERPWETLDWIDEGRVLVAATAQRIILWDLDSGSSRQLSLGIPPPIVVAAGGQTVAYGNAHGRGGLAVRRIDKPDVVQLLRQTSQAELMSLALSADGTTLAAAYGPAGIKIWDLSQGELQRTMAVAARVIAISPDGRKVAGQPYGSERELGSVTLWDVATGEKLKQMAGPIGTVHSLAFSNDGRLLALLTHNGTVRIWRVP